MSVPASGTPLSEFSETFLYVLYSPQLKQLRNMKLTSGTLSVNKL